MTETELTIRNNLIKQDKWLFFALLSLIIIGIITIFSAAAGFSGRGTDYVVRQLIIACVSLAAFTVVIAVGHEKIFEMAYQIYFIILLVLLFTIFFAPQVTGSRRWLVIAGWGLQPSEFAKVVICLGLSKYLNRNPPITIKSYIGAFLFVLPIFLLILMQPDLGSSMVFIVITLCAVFVAGAPKRYLFATIALGILALPIGWIFLKEYQKVRLLIFLDPAADPLGAGYSVMQSRITIGSGGLWGKGYLEGMQSKLHFLPEAHTDFIFSVYCEEFGFIGSLIVLTVFCFLFLRILQTGLKSRDTRSKILVTCISAWIWFQMFESIGMSMGILPVTGLPLPLLSYGGSSMVSILVALALVSSIHISNIKSYKIEAV
ncbi:MAG: rod shape-determining protein RodA [Synergistaceae bacterium]|nr:rod shape-determining protein RodA [Synergistaceae bacterium]